MNEDSDFPRSPTVHNFKNMDVTYMKILCTLFSIVTYLADIILDILVAQKHLEDERYIYFGLTILFIAIPPIIMTIFTMFWYRADEASELDKTPVWQWVIRIILLVFLMAPVLRNLEALYYAFKSTRCERKKAKENYGRRMAYENLDASMLRLFQAFVQCAPQVTLQVYIIGKEFPKGPEDFKEIHKLQLVSVFTSVLSASLAVASYQVNLRSSLDYKNDINCTAAIFPFFWRFCELTSRLLALGLFGAVYEPFIPVMFSMHFIIMFMVTRIISAGFCGSGPGEVMYNLLLAYMYIYCFINPKDDNTRGSYAFYYCLNLTENAVMISVWYKLNSQLSIYCLPVFVLVLSTFGFALVIMIFYYTLLHPTRGKLFGKPSPIRPDDTIERIEHIAREFGLDEEIINRFRRERENIPTKNAADFFQNVPEKGTKKKKKSWKRQAQIEQVEDTAV